MSASLKIVPAEIRAYPSQDGTRGRGGDSTTAAARLPLCCRSVAALLPLCCCSLCLDGRCSHTLVSAAWSHPVRVPDAAPTHARTERICRIWGLGGRAPSAER